MTTMFMNEHFVQMSEKVSYCSLGHSFLINIDNKVRYNTFFSPSFFRVYIYTHILYILKWHKLSIWRHILFTLSVWCRDICDSANFHSLDFWHLLLNSHFHRWYCHSQPQTGHRGITAYCTYNSWNISGGKRFLVSALPFHWLEYSAHTRHMIHRSKTISCSHFYIVSCRL